MDLQPKEVWLYYAGISLLSLLLFLRARPQPGFRLIFRKSARQLEGQSERPLNVMFNFNGHSWDAHEVLGLPAGASIESVERAYRSACEQLPSGHSRAFLDAAVGAIRAQSAGRR